MAEESGHRYMFPAPKGGWPSFDGKGRVVKDSSDSAETDGEDESSLLLAGLPDVAQPGKGS